MRRTSRKSPNGLSTMLRIHGLRTRLVLVFVLVAVLGAAAAAWAGTEQAARSLTELTQQQRTQTLVEQVTAAAPQIGYPPNQDDLDLLRAAAGENAAAVYEDEVAASGFFAEHSVPVTPSTGMRRAVRSVGDDGRTYTERILVDGAAWLIVGAPVMITEPDGRRSPSGVEVYAAQDLTGVEQELTTLTRSAVITAALVLPIAVALALLAARTVLSPVRKLSTTARRLADGDLDARTRPRGVDELAALTRTVNEMAESLQSSMVSMAQMQEDARRFAADVSHELRTPLTTLTAAVEVLGDALDHGPLSDRESPDARDARESAHLAITETRRLVQMVEDIMEIARFDSSTAPIRREPTDVLALVRSTVRARGWEAEVELPPQDPTTPITVEADRRRLDVVIANLIGNGLKHGRPPVRVLLYPQAEAVAVEITDSGPGIPDDQLGRIFGRFYKTDTSRARTGGSGLGLAIALENARLNDGDITVENAPDGGARFTLWLPGGRTTPPQKGEDGDDL